MNRIDRRTFSTAALGLGLGMVTAQSPALAQVAGLAEGKDYVRLSQPQPVPPGKIEVIEFFWYGCPHCNAFEPTLEAWIKKLPADVAFRRVPVAFANEPFVAHQKLFYTLEAMGQLEAMHRKVFYAIHNERQRLDKTADITAFVTKNGGDGAKFAQLFDSFSVQTKATQAKRLAEAYRIDGVPALGIHGRYYTSGQITGSNERALAVTDALIQSVRKPA
jgi:thiol:disulfide interchange protein DsbA